MFVAAGACRERPVHNEAATIVAGGGDVRFHHLIVPRRSPGAVGRDGIVAALRGPPGVQRLLNDFEEFCSILAANIYRQERGFTSLRKDHWGHDRLEGDLLDSGAYYEKYRPSIDKWFSSQGGFCLELARSNVKFNPLREAAIARGLMLPPPVSMRLP